MNTLLAFLLALTVPPQTDTTRGPIDARDVAGVVTNEAGIDVYWRTRTSSSSRCARS